MAAAATAEPSPASPAGSLLDPTDANPLPVSSPLKRKRPPMIQIPQVLQEIPTDRLRSRHTPPQRQDGAICVTDHGCGVAVSSVKGKKQFMEDAHRIFPCASGNSKKGFFGVYDGHGGKKAAEFVAENLHANVLEMLENSTSTGDQAKQDAVRAGYLKTDEEFLKQGLGSGTCCVTALIEKNEIVISNLGDCRAILSKGGVAEALTTDHRAEIEEERKRIENNGGYVEIHRGAWRVHGVLSVSRSIGDAHLKNWVLAEPETRILNLTEDMEFLILATDGLWEKVGNQEAVDVLRSRFAEKRAAPEGFSSKENDGEHCCVNTSPSPKLRKVMTVKKRITSKSPSCLKQRGSWKETWDCFSCENEGPPLKAQKLSLVKRKNLDIQSPTEETMRYKKSLTSAGLADASKELVNLALCRGSMDDITVMTLDLNEFRCSR